MLAIEIPTLLTRLEILLNEIPTPICLQMLLNKIPTVIIRLQMHVNKTPTLFFAYRCF